MHFKQIVLAVGLCNAAKLASAEDHQQIRKMGRNERGHAFWSAFKALCLCSLAAWGRSPPYSYTEKTPICREALLLENTGLHQDNCLHALGLYQFTGVLREEIL